MSHTASLVGVSTVMLLHVSYTLQFNLLFVTDV